LTAKAFKFVLLKSKPIHARDEARMAISTRRTTPRARPSANGRFRIFGQGAHHAYDRLKDARA
jgi:hypothetical protein